MDMVDEGFTSTSPLLDHRPMGRPTLSGSILNLWDEPYMPNHAP